MVPQGDSLRYIRKTAGLSQAQVAKAIGVTRVYYTQIENGHRIPRPSVLKAIGDTLGLSMDQVYAVVGRSASACSADGGGS